MSAAAEKKENPIRVLIVDDESYVRTLLSRWLTEEGYACECAENVPEAIGLLKAARFDLLVSDIRMPGPSGIDLLATVRECCSHMAVVMVTALDDRDTAVHAIQLGAYVYVPKPFGKNEIVIHAMNALEHRRLALAAEEYQHRLEAEVRERTDDIRRREEEIIYRLVSAAEFRDDETGTHIRRIGLYCGVLAEEAGWTAQAADDLRLAAAMHDIGKIGVPDHILLKPGKLTGEEYETIKTHTIIGAELLSQGGGLQTSDLQAMRRRTVLGAAILGDTDIPLLNQGKEIALCHHEKWDGSGYPQGLAGEAIPESARIVAVADVYDALTTDRIYRPAVCEPEAMQIMHDGRGTHFDPGLFDCFLGVLPEFHRIGKRLVG